MQHELHSAVLPHVRLLFDLILKSIFFCLLFQQQALLQWAAVSEEVDYFYCRVLKKGCGWLTWFFCNLFIILVFYIFCFSPFSRFLFQFLVLFFSSWSLPFFIFFLPCLLSWQSFPTHTSNANRVHKLFFFFKLVLKLHHKLLKSTLSVCELATGLNL